MSIACRRARASFRPRRALAMVPRSTCASALARAPKDYPRIDADEGRPLDPFHALEDPYHADTKAFVAQQQVVAEETLQRCRARGAMQERLKQLLDHPRRSAPRRRGGKRAYYTRNRGLQAQDDLCVTRGGGGGCETGGKEEEDLVVVDPTRLGGAISSYEASQDGRKLAYAFAKGGSDWCEVRFVQLNHEDEDEVHVEELPDRLQYVKFTGLAWNRAGDAIVYNQYPPPNARKENAKDSDGNAEDGEDKGSDPELGTETNSNRGQQLMYHRMGTSQEKDVILWKAEGEQEEWMASGEITDDGKYLVVGITHGCDPVNRLVVLDLEEMGEDIEEGCLMKKGRYMVNNFDAQYDYVANDGTIFTFKTNLNSPRYKLVRVDLSDESKVNNPQDWMEVLSQSDHVLKWAAALKGDVMVCDYLVDAKDVLQVRKLSNGDLLEELDLPIGSVTSFSGRREDSDFYFKFQTFTEPGTIYRVDTAEGKSKTPEVFHRSELKDEKYDPDCLVTEQIFATSKDGTQVPMFVTYQKGMKRDGNNLTMLYGYGGFNISLTPSFSASQLAFVLGFGGIAVTANLRGGGEYGEEWHKAGSLKNKQNVFDDFIASAEHLIQLGYTNPAKLAIQGGSNGGLLVAACTNQRPDLFGCAIAHVGVMDMLRFHKFTIGHAWCSEYGCADNSEEEYQNLLAYSPIHNVRIPECGEGEYPSMMLLTGDHDDRVVPLHTLKLVATIQSQMKQVDKGRDIPRNPVIARIESQTGHGAGKPTDKVIEQYADVYAFIGECLGGEWR